MKRWDKIGKIKSLVILVICLISLTLSFNGSKESNIDNLFRIIFVIFLITFIFFSLSIKLWSLFGVQFEKPNWNENPISLKISKSLNLLQFIAFWFICAGLINVVIIGLFKQKISDQDFIRFFAGIGLLLAINLGLKWSGRNEKREEITENQT